MKIFQPLVAYDWYLCSICNYSQNIGADLLNLQILALTVKSSVHSLLFPQGASLQK